jgi:ribonucleoside-diphosphate reductase alpha chain
MKASNQLAKEMGACPKFNETTYSKGIMPIDTYKKAVDEYCDEPLHLDWDGLRKSIMEHGMRNSTLSALMPSETSSQISNATNGIEPPRGLISVKASKDGVLKQVVPEIERLREQYELLWNIPNNTGYLQLVGVMQKFVDQTISANTNYDPLKFNDHKVPMQQLLKDLLLAYKYGVKTLYYHNTRDQAGTPAEGSKAAAPTTVVIEEDEGCEGGACKI